MKTVRRDAHRRPERVAARIQREIARVIAVELADPRLAGVVIAGVEITDDLSKARVAFVVMGDAPGGVRTQRALQALNGMRSAVRTKLATRLDMRRVPEVYFAQDVGREEANRMDALLHEVSQELKKAGD